ncbi:putative gamma-glutamyltransferase YwrD [Roseovarius sp. A-2]|uniref:gamma-glutamyltransferase family protein n=1 Tax=Roseovarius sp. A-2 TaxID=1570360 RepID=UPI0009B5366B|nr:gamma-glutamyltransferase family protein [Roseovarius sp. A-2]GAW35068.1 putative gamma-glutamyltransferase YwrD [Roseovarius sp. A-2]
MLQTPRSTRGMVVAPHHLASESGLRVLRDGGNAIEAMIASAATISVVYPHMNGLGGDNFWLIRGSDGKPVGIDACGGLWNNASADFYCDLGLDRIPSRGPLAAITVAGAVSGWAAAHKLAAAEGGKLPLSRLFEDAIYYARNGVPTSRTQHENTKSKLSEFDGVSGYADTYLHNGKVPEVGELFLQKKIAATLEHLASKGLDDFYTGDLARAISEDLEQAGSPIRLEDLKAHRARQVEPLSVRAFGATVYNMPPPTQGIASLMILGIYERLQHKTSEDYGFVHGLVESTKRAFRARNAHVTDPKYMTKAPQDLLDPGHLDKLAAQIDAQKAAPWDDATNKGDTVWLGAIDGEGRSVSFIQSLYWEFGSGVVLPQSGITWQNRGTTFSLDSSDRNPIAPGRKPFHTIQPPIAVFDDGRSMVYGTMGGEGQPQTQAMVFTRYSAYGQELQHSVTAPRWLLGRTWGEAKMNLRIENRLSPQVIDALVAAGHDTEVIGQFDEIMGHAGAIVRHPSGVFEGAVDPRGDGIVAAY